MPASPERSPDPSHNPNPNPNPKSSFSAFAIASSFLGHLRRLSSAGEDSNRSRPAQPDTPDTTTGVDDNPFSLDLPPLVLCTEPLSTSPKPASPAYPRPAYARPPLLTATLAEQVRQHVPARSQLYETWNLAYSLERDGASLATLYHKCAAWDGKAEGRYGHEYDGLFQEGGGGGGGGGGNERGYGYVLVVRDTKHQLFGAYVNEYFRPCGVNGGGGRRYYGNGDCFLWTCVESVTGCDSKSGVTGADKKDEGGERGEGEKDQPFTHFPYTGLNDYLIFTTPTYLSLGGGDGHYGLWLDAYLERGVSSRSLTFGNVCLSGDGSTGFGVLGVEVWRVG